MTFAQVITHHAVGSTSLWQPVRRRATHRAAALTLAALLVVTISASPLAQAQTFTVLHSFNGPPGDGANPLAGLIMDGAGNLYGTTVYGGSAPCDGYGCGTVFKLDAHGVETILYNFRGVNGGGDGQLPYAGLFRDAKGELYGTTYYGGNNPYNCNYGSVDVGCGVVFKLSGQKETILYRFTGGRDGKQPSGRVVMDASGVLYGMTYGGGDPDFPGGVVFRLKGKKETVLHSFSEATDGNLPKAGPILDAEGTLYGTTSEGGDVNCNYPSGCGVVFKLSGTKETILHRFSGPEGAFPYATLFRDAAGNLYSTTVLGGNNGAGTVFEITPSNKERVLHGFNGTTGGFRPTSGVIRDAEGNVYGTDEQGGKTNAGIAYEITKDGKERILHDFCADSDCKDGVHPTGDLIMDGQGNLYGTAYDGGIGANGTVFKITLPPSNK